MSETKDPRVGNVEQSLGGVDTVVSQIRPLSEAEKETVSSTDDKTNDNNTSGNTGSGTNKDSKIDTPESDTQSSDKQGAESNGSQGDDKSGETTEVDKSKEDKQEESANEETSAINLQEFITEEFMETGKLSEEHIQKVCEAYNLTPDAADYLAAGMHVRLKQREAAVYEPVGGKEQFEAMKVWAEANFTDAQKETFDKAVTGNDEGLVRKALVDLKNRYVEANGSPNVDRGKLLIPTLSSNASSNANVQTYKSYNEYREAMKDSRYGTDPAYTQEVIDKGLLSQRAGIF